MNQGEIEILANASFLSSDEVFDDSQPLDVSRTKRDVFDMTVWKLHSLNRPTRRDSSLRKSVLIFNLLRCLQRDNAYNVAYDVDMVPDGSNCMNQQDNTDFEDGCQDMDDDDDDGMIDDDLTDESDTSSSSDPETKSAVGSLTMIDQEKDTDTQSAINVSFQFSSVTESAWDSVSRGTVEPNMMDVDHRSDLASFGGLSSGLSDTDHHRSGNDGLITESYRLLESGPCIIGDQSYPCGHGKSYATAVASANGEYRPFGTGGFNLFA